MKLLRVLFAIAWAVVSAASFAQSIDINTATAEQLDKGLKGIGPKKAADIVKYRETNGLFQSVDDLANVPGIKGKTLEKIRPLVTVGGAEPATAPAVSAPAATSVKPVVPTTSTLPATKPAAPTTSTLPATKPAVPTTSTLPAAPTAPR